MPEKNAKQGNVILLLMVGIVAVISAGAGVTAWKFMQGRLQQPTGALIVLPEPRVVADFALIDQDGQPFSLDDLRGRWSLIFFGFTHCPDVCPSTLYDLQRVHESLQTPGGAKQPEHQVVFISVDPGRDTPEKLKQYASYFHPDFIAVTGPDEQLAPLTRQLGIAYRIEPHGAGAMNYGVDHSASVLLTDPDGRLHGVFPAPHDAGLLAADMKDVLE
jgi:protein SCO1/2